MTTVVTRTIRSVPYRSARETWQCIVDILTVGGGLDHRAELERVMGIAASIITEKSPDQAPIVVLGGGPRVRIYCLYDESALEADVHNEAPLSFDPMEGDWTVSLPCPADDLAWVSEALQKRTLRVTARDQAEGIEVPVARAQTSTFELNVGEFMKP